MVDVTVTTPAGTSPTGPADRYTYLTPGLPVINGLDTNHGTPFGGTSVIIYGTDLFNATAVSFGTASGSHVVSFDGTSVQVTSPSGTAGSTVDVTVTTPIGTSSKTSADLYTFVSAGRPIVNAVSPNRGATAGGTNVTIFGDNFTGATMVDFGTSSAAFINVVSDSRIQVTSPPGTAGTLDVTVMTPGGTSAIGPGDLFTFFAQPVPAVTAVSPNSGSPGARGYGMALFISGSGFMGTTAVSFGTACVSRYSFFVLSDDVIEVFNIPSGPPNTTVDVTVTTPSGTSSPNAADTFAYTVPASPTVTSVQPQTGPSAGGTIVYVTGTSLASVTAVLFGTIPANFFFPYSDSLIYAASPPGTNGTTVDVTVRNPGGISATGAADRFTWAQPLSPLSPW
jgi:hypothetical protein